MRVEWRERCRRKSACALCHVVYIVYLCYHSFRILTNFVNFIRQYIYRDCRSYGTCAQNGTRKDFLGTWHSLLSELFFISFVRPASLHYDEFVYIHTQISDCLGTVYELSLLPSKITSDIFWHKSIAARSFDGIFVTRAPVWRWPDQYITLDKRFSLLFKQEVAAAAPFTATCSS